LLPAKQFNLAWHTIPGAMADHQTTWLQASSTWPDSFPVLGHVNHHPAPVRVLVQAPGQTADQAVTVLGPLTLGIGVVNDHP